MLHNPEKIVEVPVDIPLSGYDRISPYYYHEVGLADVDLSRYDEFLAADKGVIPVKKDGLWGLVSYDGEELLSPIFAKCYRTPNEQGYAVFQDGADRFYITARTGDIIYKADPSVIDLRISGYNIIYSRQRLEGDEHKYLFFDGTVTNQGNMGPYTPFSATDLDFYLVQKDTEPGKYAVMSVSDKKALVEFTLEELVSPYYEEWDEELQSVEFVPYDCNGTTLYDDWAKFCLKAVNTKGKEKYFIFDGYEWTENQKYECVCLGVYDYVEFFTSGVAGGVWPVKEEDDYYYMRVCDDYEKILGPFDDAAMFWYDNGIALEGKYIPYILSEY